MRAVIQEEALLEPVDFTVGYAAHMQGDKQLTVTLEEGTAAAKLILDVALHFTPTLFGFITKRCKAIGGPVARAYRHRQLGVAGYLMHGHLPVAQYHMVQRKQDYYQ